MSRLQVTGCVKLRKLHEVAKVTGGLERFYYIV